MVERRSAPRPRQAGRAILCDDQSRVLLIYFVLPNMRFWATPGGGVEKGETLLQTAQRELQEELGITVTLEGPIHTATGIFEFEGELIENTDHFFHGSWNGTPRLSGATANESAALQEARWWTPEEVEAAKEPIFPRDLGGDSLAAAGLGGDEACRARLGRTRCRHAHHRLLRLLAQRIVGMAAIAFEEGAGFHRKGFVQDIAFDMAGGAEQHLAGADAADYPAAHGDIVGDDLAMNLGFVADHQADAADIAFHLAVDLHVAGRDQRAGDDSVGGKDRGGGGARRLVALLGRGRGNGRQRRQHGLILGFAREHGGLPQ